MADGCTTTKKDFEIFKKEANAWIKKFGLADWYVEYSHADEFDDARAWCQTDWSGRHCVIGLTITWDRKPTILDIKGCAFHEVAELLLGLVRDRAMSRYNVSEEDIDGSIHYVIRTLENSIFKPMT